MSVGQCAVKPGMRMGLRPERMDVPGTDPIDQAWARWTSHKIQPELVSLKRFAAKLHRISEAENRFSAMDLAQRNSAVIDVRQRLCRAEGGYEALATAFALIRWAMVQTLGIRLHNEQLYAGWCLHEGHFIEMQTGEGKTLTAALPAIAMALAGVPVHVVTSNEYLAQRDKELLTPLYNWFGLKAGVVKSDQDDECRRQNYACDITYCTHQQVVFDYLRDSRVQGNQRTGLTSRIRELLHESTTPALQRGLCFAIVDEADSVLVDDARMPLILAEAVNTNDHVAAEAAVALAIARTLLDAEHFDKDMRARRVTLTDSGLAKIDAQVLHLSGGWQMPRYRNERIIQALTALYFYRRDIDYFIQDRAVVLIDQATGRATPQRRLQHGLHRMLEVKEHCTVTDETMPVSALSFQRFFTRYHRLCGMSGTLREARHELRQVYGPRTVIVPSFRPCKRTYLPMVVHSARDAQISALVERVAHLQRKGSATLIGTRTVSLSERVSQALSEAGIEHEVLNARQDADEAGTVARAGEAGRVTVATNMAGRGTDIKCSQAVLDTGGLHVINLEINEAARLDRQLHGRAARQGEPGSCQDFLCLDDEVLSSELNKVWFRVLAVCARYPAGSIGGRICYWVVRHAQRNLESGYRRQRLAVRTGQTQLQRSLAIGGFGE